MGSEKLKKFVAEYGDHIKYMCGLSELRILGDDEPEPPWPSGTTECGVKCFLDVGDVAKEQQLEQDKRKKARLQKQLDKAESKMTPGFIERAPKDLVQKARNRTAELKRQIADLNQ
jgi:valyl-tRNA synthetase